MAAVLGLAVMALVIESMTIAGAFSVEVVFVLVVAAGVAVALQAATVVEEHQLEESLLGRSFV